MSDEIKTEIIENCNCKTCQCKEKLLKGLGEFLFKAAVVYVGVTLAILTSATVLKPKHHPHMHRAHIGIERQMPPHMIKGDFGKRIHKGHRPDFRNFEDMNRPNPKRIKPNFDGKNLPKPSNKPTK